nr:hypothetical protein [Tanacetum cinerariifolium]GEZ25289.1 hypothetical protein [Tanacetum cinerariifolium]GEZ25299.1 hypothetical protein [Tanacetum cinerariifolium]
MIKENYVKELLLKEYEVRAWGCELTCLLPAAATIGDFCKYICASCSQTEAPQSRPSTNGGGGGGSVDVVLVVAVKLEGTSANAVRALKKFVLCRVSKEI